MLCLSVNTKKKEALRAENGRDINGNSIIVEWAKGRSDRPRDKNRGGGSFRGGDRGFRGGDRFGDRDRNGGGGGGFRGGRGGGGGSRGGEGCFNCGVQGHFARECGRSGGRGGGYASRGGGGVAGFRRDRYPHLFTFKNHFWSKHKS